MARNLPPLSEEETLLPRKKGFFKIPMHLDATALLAFWQLQSPSKIIGNKL